MQDNYRMDIKEPYVRPVYGFYCSICKFEHTWRPLFPLSFVGFVPFVEIRRTVNSNLNLTKPRQDERNKVTETARKFNLEKLAGVAAPIGLLLLTMTIPGVSSVHVEWKLKKEPVFFGKDLQLQCQIDDKENDCKNNHRQWLGGKNYDLLCKDGVCPSAKCKETVDEMCMYTLVVNNVTEEDINCPYTCSYGIYHQRKYLMLDEDIFVYDPTIEENRIKKNISLENGDINIFIKMEKVYPAPECVILFEHENISKAEDINTTMRSDGFFTTEVKVASRLSTCKGVVEVICRIGKENRRIVDFVVDFCKGDDKMFEPWVWVTLIFVCTGAAIGLIGMWLMLMKGYKRSSNTETHQERPQEMAPMMKC